MSEVPAYIPPDDVPESTVRPVTQPLPAEPVLHYGHLLGLGDAGRDMNLAREFAAAPSDPVADAAREQIRPARPERPVWTGGFSPTVLAVAVVAFVAVLFGAWQLLSSDRRPPPVPVVVDLDTPGGGPGGAAEGP